MELDPLSLKVKRPKKKLTKEEIERKRKNNLDKSFTTIVRKISTGDFDPNNLSHQIMAKIARLHGIIDEDNNILKEEYLICLTKRHKS